MGRNWLRSQRWDSVGGFRRLLTDASHGNRAPVAVSSPVVPRPSDALLCGPISPTASRGSDSAGGPAGPSVAREGAVPVSSSGAIAPDDAGARAGPQRPIRLAVRGWRLGLARGRGG